MAEVLQYEIFCPDVECPDGGYSCELCWNKYLTAKLGNTESVTEDAAPSGEDGKWDLNY
jgi:hypothetical protein